VAPELPPPRHEPYAIGLVCLGNICRSPIADVVLTERLLRAGLGDTVRVESSGTGTWHLGEAINPPAASVLSAAGYDPSHHVAKRFDQSWFDDYDLILAMDAANLVDIRALARMNSDRERVLMFRSFDPYVPDDSRAPDVPDPFGGPATAFADVLAVVERTSDVIVAHIDKLLSTRRR
jgi:low molecular weight protein-tyrosine phosphatase